MPADLTDAPPAILFLTRDLFFLSRVTGTAQILGLTVQVVGRADEAVRRLAADAYRGLLVDLADQELDVAQLMAALPPQGRPRVIAFGPHVATSRLDAARQAGCDVVLPRSRFTTELPTLLGQFAARPPTDH